MRLQHGKQAASGLSTDEPARVQAKTAIVAEVERLRWRIWNGKAKSARISLDRARTVMHAFGGERGHRRRGVPSRKLWHEVNDDLRGQGVRPVNYAERYRAVLRVGTSVTEGTPNFLINRRMNKAKQMRWSRRGAGLLLQVRSDIYNRVFEAGPLANARRGSVFRCAHTPCWRCVDDRVTFRTAKDWEFLRQGRWRC
jgi:hypothetical protein